VRESGRLVAPPLTADHGAALEEPLGPARALGFTVPIEAAVHLHLDGAAVVTEWLSSSGMPW
jgi:hypothetical protein